MVDDGMSGGDQPMYTITVDDAPKFDLRSYVSTYKGRTVFRRLYLVASCSTVLREEATRMALIEAKKGSDVNNYNAAVALLKALPNAKDVESLIDPSWAKEQDKKNVAETKRMENELKQYKNNLIRESIRMGNEDLGQHYHNIGDLNNATKAFSRMRDFCTASAHIVSTAFRIIAVAIERRDWGAVQTQVHKIRNLQMRGDEVGRTQSKTSTALGLQQMCVGDYKEAALSFLSTDPALGDSYNDVLTSNDVAVYGGLCALASMSRSELQSEVLENTNFRNFLELEPHIRRAIAYFCASKYSQCLEILESYRADYMLDVYLQNQVNDIYDRVRTKSIVQYFKPFSKVTLSSMEKMFGNPSKKTTVTTTSTTSVTPEFQAELTGLIQSGQLSAHIDTESQTLIADIPNPRAETQKQALEMVDHFIQEARLKLLRMNVISAGLEVKPPVKDKKAAGVAGAMDLVGMMDVNMNGNGNGNGGSIGAGANFQGTGYSLRANK